ncbi:MAG TPA: 4-oxalocrotonate tautomerase [Betaproteobacteria bacterium]|nr:4-oxalocrotonate tautomerase [Betaproteobacteria bacterium]
MPYVHTGITGAFRRAQGRKIAGEIASALARIARKPKSGADAVFDAPLHGNGAIGGK